jgi:Flp pilus assembly protein TadD
MVRHFNLVSAVLLATLTWPLRAQNQSTRLQRGPAMAHKGDSKAALVDLQAVIASDPRNELALNTIGVCETRLGHPERAIESFQRLASLTPSNWRAWSNLGANHLASDQSDLTVVAFRRASKLEPGAASVWFNLGFGYNSPLLFGISSDRRPTLFLD